MNKSRFFVLSLICLLFAISEVQAKTIHAILVADTVNNITEVTEPNITLFQQELRQVCKHTQLGLKEKIFVGKDFNSDKIMAHLQGLQIDPSDVIFFYFSGHGFHAHQKKSHWPNMEFYRNEFDFEKVINVVKAKQARLSLVFADCCNNYHEQANEAVPRNINVNLENKRINPEGYRRLFLDAKGCIAVCSASPGQFSYGCHKGGLYTQCFLTSLNHELANPNPNWKSLLDRASKFIGRVQKPIAQLSH